MKELDELRKFIHECCALVDDAIEEHAARIEQAIADRYMELPLDADGVPIHLGDLLYRSNGDMHYCHGIGKPSLEVMDEHLTWWRSECFHHVKPRTIEDVLREFEAEVESCNNTHETARRYAELIERMVRDGQAQ